MTERKFSKPLNQMITITKTNGAKKIDCTDGTQYLDVEINILNRIKKNFPDKSDKIMKAVHLLKKSGFDLFILK